MVVTHSLRLCSCRCRGFTAALLTWPRGLTLDLGASPCIVKISTAAERSKCLCSICKCDLHMSEATQHLQSVCHNIVLNKPSTCISGLNCDVTCTGSRTQQSFQTIRPILASANDKCCTWPHAVRLTPAVCYTNCYTIWKWHSPNSIAQQFLGLRWVLQTSRRGQYICHTTSY